MAEFIPSIISRDPSNVGGESCISKVSGTIISFSGYVEWYPEDESLGRAAGYRVGVQITPSESVTDPTKSTWEFNGKTYNGADIVDTNSEGKKVFWFYPLVTEGGKRIYEIKVLWTEIGIKESFEVRIDNDIKFIEDFTPIESLDVEKLKDLKVYLTEPCLMRDNAGRQMFIKEATDVLPKIWYVRMAPNEYKMCTTNTELDAYTNVKVIAGGGGEGPNPPSGDYATKAELNAVKKDVASNKSELESVKSNVQGIQSQQSVIETLANDAKTVADSAKKIAEDIVVPTKVSELNNDSDYQSADQVNERIQLIVGSAPEALDTLQEIAKALGEDPNFAATVTKLISDNTKLIEGIKATAVQYVIEGERKHIILANHDSIAGTTTTGGGANLVMLSKWDKADFGSSTIECNLNAKDGIVTINDAEIIVTESKLAEELAKLNIPSIEGLAKTEEVAQMIADAINGLAKSSDVTAEIAEATKDSVKYQTFDETRKTIQLANHDTISGLKKDGTGVNLAMVSKLDKADFGSPNLPINLNGSEPRPTYNDTEEVALMKDLPDTSKAEGNAAAALSRLAIVEAQLKDLKKTSPESIEYSEDSNLDQPDKDLIITGSGLTGVKSINGRSVELADLKASDARVAIKATEDAFISEFENSGNLPKSTSNSAVSINTDKYVTITKSNFKQTGYNSIEIGLNDTAPKSIVIDGLDFDAKLDNNAILIFAHAKDAIINISNCHFKDVSNAIRLSNRLNVPATINITNCTIDKWDANEEFAGFLIMQDYTSGSIESEQSNNLFKNLTINFINLIGPDGKKIKPENVADVCTGGSGQRVVYIWNSKEGHVQYDVNRYPTITFS